MSILLKMAGVTYVAEFASGICKDAGYQNIAVQIEIFTKLTILAIGMPVLLSLLELKGKNIFGKSSSVLCFYLRL